MYTHFDELTDSVTGGKKQSTQILKSLSYSIMTYIWQQHEKKKSNMFIIIRQKWLTKCQHYFMTLLGQSIMQM